MSGDLAFLPATELIAAYRDKRVSPVEATVAVLVPGGLGDGNPEGMAVWLRILGAIEALYGECVAARATHPFVIPAQAGLQES